MDQSQVDEALRLKTLWSNRSYPLALALDARGSGPGAGLEAFERVLATLQQYPVFAVDAPKQADRRCLRSTNELRQDARYVMEELKQLEAYLPEGAVLSEVEALFDRAVKLLEGKTLYVRPGPNGLADLLDDNVFTLSLLEAAVDRRPELDLGVYLKTLPMKVRAAPFKALRAGGPSAASRALALLPSKHQAAYERQVELAEANDWKTIAIALQGTRAVIESTRLKKIDPSVPEKLPIEVQLAAELSEGFRGTMQDLAQRGCSLTLHKSKRTPPSVLAAIARISVASQHNTIRGWLPPLVLEGRKPHLAIDSKGVKAAVKLKVAQKGALTQESLAQDVASIEDAVGSYLRVLVHGPNGEDLRHLPEVKALNEALASPRAEWAARRMVFDNADERTHEAQGVIKQMAFVGPVAHGLELMQLGSLAKVFAGSLDDVIGEYAEVQALRGSGFSNSAVLKRLRLAVPVFGLATMGSFEVEHLLAGNHQLAAGALFGMSAVALSLTTSLQSVAMYKEAYDELAKEGKIDGKVQPLLRSESFQRELAGWEQARKLLSPTKAEAMLSEILPLVRKHLLLLNQTEMEDLDVDGMMDELEKLDYADLLARSKPPGTRERWKAAVLEDLANPARLGILIGASLSPVVGMGVGAAGLLGNGFALAAVGSVEALAAGAAVMAARVATEKRYQSHIKRRLEDARKASAPQAPTLGWVAP